jgi:hypothetical protein
MRISANPAKPNNNPAQNCIKSRSLQKWDAVI